MEVMIRLDQDVRPRRASEMSRDELEAFLQRGHHLRAKAFRDAIRALLRRLRPRRGRGERQKPAYGA